MSPLCGCDYKLISTLIHFSLDMVASYGHRLDAALALCCLNVAQVRRREDDFGGGAFGDGDLEGVTVIGLFPAAGDEPLR